MATLTNKTLIGLRSMVQLNDHGGAYQLAAQTLEFGDLAERFRKINCRQLELGHLPYNLYAEREGLYADLMTRAKAMLSPSEYQQLYRST